jgi:protein gp37
VAENSKIEWTDHTFNPWIGCTKVSLGCDNCYAAAQDKFRSWTPEGWGGPRKRTAPSTWAKPVQWNKAGFRECADCGWRGEWAASFVDSDIGGDHICPKCQSMLVRPTRRRVFCSSLADVFDNQVPAEWRADLFRLIAATPNLDWLLLTKRIGNAATMIREYLDSWTPPLPALHHNVWLGATVVNQEEADRDIPKLLAVPARVRFLSMEPLLGPVNLWLPTRHFMTGRGPFGDQEPVAMCDHCCNGDRCDDPTHYERGRPEWRVRCPHCRGTGRGRPIDWVIVGGESGPGARPMQLQWGREIVRQCRAAGVPVLVKQLGRHVLDDGMSSPGEHWPAGTDRRSGVPRPTERDPGFMVHMKDRKGGDWSEWPEDLRVREFPEVRS